MESFYLNIALLIFGFFSAVVAIGGDTWDKAEPSLLKRITRRGWFAIVCFMLTLGVGIRKEVVSKREEELRKVENAQQTGRIQTQLEQIKDLKTELQKANNIVSETQKHLLEAQTASKKTAEGIQEHVYQRLYRETYGLLGLISAILEEASDGWLPTTETEFFSRRSVSMFCRELNADGPARVSPAQPWSAWFSRRVREYKANLAETIKAYGPQLGTVLLQALSKVEDSMTFTFIPQWQNLRQSPSEDIVRRYPPLLCYGDGFVDMVLKDFANLHELYSETSKGAKRLGIKTTSFPLPKPGPNLGKNRFTPEQLTKWQKDHQIPAQ